MIRRYSQVLTRPAPEALAQYGILHLITLLTRAAPSHEIQRVESSTNVDNAATQIGSQCPCTYLRPSLQLRPRY